MILGSPTLNNNMMPQLADYITYMKGLRPAGKLGACFGSYGWSGEAVKNMNKQLKEANIALLDESGIRHQWVPDKEALQNCYDLGIKAGQAIQS
jgi:flavorubredoxin